MFRDILFWRHEKRVRVLLKIRDHSLKLPIIGGVSAEELFGLHQAQAVRGRAVVMRETRSEVTPQLVHSLSGESLHKGAEGKLIRLTAPALDPVQVTGSGTRVCNRDLGHQHGIVAEWSKYDLVDPVSLTRYFLTKVADAKHAIKTVSIAGIERAQHRFPVGQISESAGKAAALGRIVIQKLRCTFILPDSNMSVVRRDRQDPIIAHLVDMFGRSQYARIHLGHGFLVVDLIAGVMKRRQSELILNPPAKVAGAVGLLRIGRRWQ